MKGEGLGVGGVGCQGALWGDMVEASDIGETTSESNSDARGLPESRPVLATPTLCWGEVVRGRRHREAAKLSKATEGNHGGPREGGPTGYTGKLKGELRQATKQVEHPTAKPDSWGTHEATQGNNVHLVDAKGGRERNVLSEVVFFEIGEVPWGPNSDV